MNKLDQLHKKVNNKPKEYRKGQAYFNYLYDDNPQLANEIRGTNLDPFHRDDIIPKFLEFLIFNNYDREIN